MARTQPKHDPTPEEIAAATAEIRATWDEREEAFRRGCRNYAGGNYTVPECKTPPEMRNGRDTR